MDILKQSNLSDPNGEENVESATEVGLKLKSLELRTSELSNLLKQRLQFYREENARMEATFKCLSLLNEDLKFSSACTSEVLEKLSDIQQKLEATDLNIKSIALSHAERLRKHSNYMSKLKICIKMYMNLNEKLSKEIKLTKCEMEQSKSKINNVLTVSPEDIKAMEVKVKRYENELIKFEKRYPWLKDSDYNLPNISKEVDTLNTLRKEKERLLEELSIYQGLKPDIKEATDQLAEIKLEHQKVSHLLLNSQK